MMRRIAVSQRVVSVESVGERRDCLDQRWAPFLARCGLLAVPVPNDPDIVAELHVACRFDGVLLTGGGDLAALGGDAPERDATEARLIGLARQQGLPVLGVCRGMQMIQHMFGVALERVDGHVAVEHAVAGGFGAMTVNSYHGFAARETVPALEVLARAADGVIEAVRLHGEPVVGIMWHPERCTPAKPADTDFFAAFFARGQIFYGQREQGC